MGAWDALEPKKSVPFCDRSVTLNVFGGPGGQCNVESPACPNRGKGPVLVGLGFGISSEF